MLSWTLAVSNVFNWQRRNKLAPLTDNLLLQPAHSLSKQIKDGKLSAECLMKSVIERAQSVQPLINAITHDCFEQALEEARSIDRLIERFRSHNADGNDDLNEEELEKISSPLLGIPISIKESIMVKGMRNTCGLWDRRSTCAEDDAVVVKNIRRLGMIPFCVTNVPEATLYWADCQNKIYGRTKNPHDLSRITGASSGGEGALISSGASIIGIGSDIGGSLRIPAQYCGIYSHKASCFLISPEGNYPALTEPRLRMFTLGPMCRYASDLRYMLKCLMNDGNHNPLQDSYKHYQPSDIGEKRKLIMEQLDRPSDLNGVKILFFNFNYASKLTYKNSIKCQRDIMLSQSMVVRHFQSKFNCQIELLNTMDNYMKKVFITWQCMLGAVSMEDRDKEFNEKELEEMFGIQNLFIELLKLPLGISKHTKEAILAISLGASIPRDRERFFALCDKFEKLASEWKLEIEEALGDNGVLIIPTLPTVAYKHNQSLLKTQDLRFPSLFNVLQLPVTHAHYGFDKQNKMPYGFSIASKPYNDALTITVAEEIEQTFGGWKAPSSQIDKDPTMELLDEKGNR